MTTHSSEERPEHIASGPYLIGLVSSFVLAYLATMLFIHTSKMIILDREYPRWRHVKEVAHSASRVRQDLLVIGDSRAKAGYIPLLIDRKTINLSLAGHTPLEGYYLLVNYLKNNPAPEKLVVSYAPIHLSRAESFWEMTVKYGFLDSDEYREVWETTARLEDKILGENDKKWQYLFLPSTYWDSMRRAVKEKRWNTNKELYSQVMHSHGHSFVGKELAATEPNQEVEIGKFVRSRTLDFYLMKLIDLAQSQNIDVFWYTMPFSELSCQNLPASYKRDFEEYLSELESRRGVKVIEKFSCFPNDQFGDSSHLYLGAKTTTHAILDGVFQTAPPVVS